MPREHIRRTVSTILLFASVSAAGSFGDPDSHEVGEFPASVTIGDVNGDDLADVAVANSLTRDISLLLSDGSGLGPEQRMDYDSGTGDARYVAIEDIDNDADRDLIVLVRGGNSAIVVFRNQGDGTFTAPEPYGGPAFGFALRMADMDGDEDLDAVVAGASIDGAAITLLRNDGSGLFEVAGTFHLATSQIVYVVDIDVADFNGDDYLDVAGGSDFASEAAVLLNDGQGGLLPAAPVDLGQQSLTGILARDVNGDDRPDLLVANICANGGELRVGLNDGAGGFVLSDVVALTDACHSFTNPTGLASGHFDDDTVIDLVYASRRSDSVRLLRGLGDGTFEASGVLPTDQSPIVVAAGDVNGDGSDDVISGNVVDGLPDTIVLLTQSAADTDADGVNNGIDNCTAVANPDQRDVDGDGHGSLCDADFDNDCATSFPDLAIMRAGFFGSDAELDLDGDGSVSFPDLAIMRDQFFTAPGPSAPGSLCNP